MQELWFLRSACGLMLIDIYMNFRDDSLNGFQVIERTQFVRESSYRADTICERVQGK